MEDDCKPSVQSQRRVNPKIHEVIKKEVIKLLDANEYTRSRQARGFVQSLVPKNGNDRDANEEMIISDTSSYRMERYFQIPIDPHDQEKMTFTCPYGTFAYRRMPFGLCNAPGTFQRCMMAIFHRHDRKTMEVFYG
ncbi:hypothetical protein Tco_0770407 [Tanacetum coccineum]|uniref:Reverse transcriptase domain-containing protein n=1 Tax=Tanacetum coccineum TaxID=301880 RepID=A0ABQ4ZDD6_9ASTR